MIRVLIIEDDPGDVILMKKMLSMDGHKEIVVENVARLSEGIEMIARAKEPYSVILLDLGLPDTLGYDTFQKAYRSFHYLPIIILSGCRDDEVVLKTLREGAQDYLVKGQINNEILIRTIRYAIERHELISRREKAERELRELNLNLERRVSEEVENHRQKEQMLIQQSKMASMGEILSMITHQWKQPLNVIALTIQIMKDAYFYKELDEDYIAKSVETIMNSLMFLSNTIDDFSNFFKPSKRKVRFNVQTVIEELLAMLKAVFNKNDIEIEIKTKEDTRLIIEGYPNEFKQVILNIMNNSRDAIIARRKTVDITGRIDIGINNNIEGDKVIISISDNGGGIPCDIIEMVFKPYFTTKENEGTGIGLYMSKTIIETNMGGSLSVRNTDDGAEFIIVMKCSNE